MDLAAHLGMTVHRLRAEMPWRELLFWRLKWQTDPWGEHRADLRMARICQTLAELQRDRVKHPDPVKLDDFLLFKRDEPEPEPETRVRGATISPATVAWLDAMSRRTAAKEHSNGA